jgi:hypothetical protein
MKQNEAANSVCISLFRANAVMLQLDFLRALSNNFGFYETSRGDPKM